MSDEQTLDPKRQASDFDMATQGAQLASAAVVVVAITVAATLGFGTVFSSSTYLFASLVGASLGALVVIAGRRMNLLFGEIMGIALIAPMIVGPLATGGMGFYEGLVRSWSDILTATPPVDPTAALKTVPFVAAFIGAFAGTELFRLRELPGLAVVGPLATLTITALFSEQTRTGALTVGLVLLVGMLVLARLHHASVSSTGVLVLALVIGVVAALASAASLLLPYADEERRFDLRDLQTPPWDPLSVPSPLSDLKAGLIMAGDDERPVLRVRGDVPVERWRMASLPAFNGVFWSVAEPDETADFVAVDTFLPAIEHEVRRGDELVFDVDILEPIGNWVPTAGVPQRLAFGDVTDARMNLQTGTIGIPEQLQPGNSYELTVTPWAELSDDELANHVFVADTGAVELELLPPVVRNLAADFSTGIDQLSGERVLAIRDNLRLGSYDLSPAPGHSFGRLGELMQVVTLSGEEGERLESELRPLVGFEEIYTASAGLLTRLSDIPVRVAVGYVIPDDRWTGRSADIFASDINAWIEVHVEGQGWVAVDVTPDRSRTPEEIEENSETASAPFADPPNSPPLPEDETPPEIEEPDDSDDDQDEDEELDEDDEVVARFTFGRAAAGATAAVIGALLMIALTIVGYKAVRRRRRRRADVASERLAGAWAELIDRVGEAGGQLPTMATPAETALHAHAIAGLDEPAAAARVERLADQVSAAAFHPIPPTIESADDAWRTYDELVAVMNSEAGPVDRLRRALDPRTLSDEESVTAQ